MADYLLTWLPHIPFMCSAVHRGDGYFPLRVVNTAAMDIYILDTFQILMSNCFSRVQGQVCWAVETFYVCRSEESPSGFVQCLHFSIFPPAVDEAGVLVCGTVSRDSPVWGVLMMV